MSNLMSKQFNTASDVNFFANNGSHKTSFMPKVTAVGTIEPNRVRRWWSGFLLLGIVFSVLGFSSNSVFAEKIDKEGHKTETVDKDKIGGLAFEDGKIIGYTNMDCIAYMVDSNSKPVGDTMFIPKDSSKMLTPKINLNVNNIAFQFSDGSIHIFDTTSWREKRDKIRNRELFAESQPTAINLNVVPNPANSNITFSMDLQVASNLHIVVVDINGNEILLLHNAQTVAGAFSKTFSVANLAKGSYFVKCEIDEKTITVPFVVGE